MIKLNLKSSLLLLQVFVVSVCSLTYELLISTANTNLLGNSVLSFSLSIGFFLAGLGFGSYITKYFEEKNLVQNFVIIESILGLTGGFSIICMYFARGFSNYFILISMFFTTFIGIFSGMEVPILTRIFNSKNFEELEFKKVISEVLSFDYFGGLAASLLFPFLLLPYFGIVKLSFIVGIINLLMAILSFILFYKAINKKRLIFNFSIFVLFILVLGLIFSSSIYNFVESHLYKDSIIFSKQSKFQRIVLTEQNSNFKMYLDGGIQFSSVDEYRYHEALILPSIFQILQKGKNNLKIAVLGGGDGLGVREILKFSENIKSIDLVDIDPEITKLATHFVPLLELNKNSLLNPKTKIHNKDAFGWMQSQNENSFDIIIADFPDPDSSEVARLYSKEFFEIIQTKLKDDGIFTTQTSGILSTPLVFGSIYKTLQQTFYPNNYKVTAYTSYVPSFGLWSFCMIHKGDLILIDLDFLQKSLIYNNPNFNEELALDKDVYNLRTDLDTKKEIKTNTLDNLILTNYSKVYGIER